MGILDDCVSRHKDCNPSCVTAKCINLGCGLVLTNSAIGVDCDRCKAFSSEHPRPDFIVLHAQSPPRWIVVEMKYQLRDVTQIINQLQAGASAVANDSRFVFPGSPAGLLPLVLRRTGRTHQADLDKLQRARLRFRGHSISILIRKCSARVTDLV